MFSSTGELSNPLAEEDDSDEQRERPPVALGVTAKGEDAVATSGTGVKRPREEEAVAPRPISGYAFDDDDDGDEREETDEAAVEAGEPPQDDNEEEEEVREVENLEEPAAEDENAQQQEGAEGEGEEEGGPPTQAQVSAGAEEEGEGEQSEGREDSGAHNEDEEAEEEGESLRAVSMRLAELEALDSTSRERYAFELRVAVEEVQTLQAFIHVQQGIIDAAAKEAAAAEEAALGPHAVEGEGDSSLAPLTATQKVRAALAKDPRVAVALERLLQAASQLRLLNARVGRLRALLGEMTARQKEKKEKKAASVSQDTSSLKDRLFGSLSRSPGTAKLMSFQEVRDAPPAQAVELADHVHHHHEKETADAAAVMKRLVQALPLITHPEKRQLMTRLLVAMGQLSRHHRHLCQYDTHLQGTLRAMEKIEEASLLTAEEWGVMAAQVTYSHDMAQLSSATSLREARAVQHNASLKQRLTALQSALSSLLISHSLSKERGAQRRDEATPTGNPPVLPLHRKAAVEVEIARLTTLREALVREVLFLRKQARGGAYGNASFVGPRFDLLLDAESGREEAAGSRRSVTGRVLARQMVLDNHQRLAGLVDALLAPRCTTAAAAEHGHHHHRSEGLDQDRGESVTALKLRLLRLEEQIACQNRTLEALVAANARLTAEIRCVSHVSEVSSEPEKAAQLARMLLMKLGLVPSRGDDDGGEKAPGPQDDLFLAAVERGVLSLLHSGANALLSTVNRSLAEMNEGWVQPEQASRATAALLLRLIALKDVADLCAVGSPAASFATPVADAVRRLEERERSLSVDRDGEGAPRLPPVLLPPADNSEAQAAFDRMLETAYAAVRPVWGSIQQACQSLREELHWYSQFNMEEVPERLTNAQNEKKLLLQRTLDAGKRFKQVNDEKQQASVLNEELKQLEETQVPQWQERVDSLKKQLRQLQEEYTRKKAESDLAREAAEQELALQEQRRQEALAEAARQQQREQPLPKEAEQALDEEGLLAADDNAKGGSGLMELEDNDDAEGIEAYTEEERTPFEGVAAAEGADDEEEEDKEEEEREEEEGEEEEAFAPSNAETTTDQDGEDSKECAKGEALRHEESSRQGSGTPRLAPSPSKEDDPFYSGFTFDEDGD